MVIIDSVNYNTLNLDGYVTVDKIHYIFQYEKDMILEACNYDTETLRHMMNTLDIKFDNVEIVNKKLIIYYVNGESLYLEDLSSGEQTMLYLLACKRLNKKIVAEGLLERLGARLTRILVDEFKDYDIVIIMYGSALKECTVPFYRKIGGIDNV